MANGNLPPPARTATRAAPPPVAAAASTIDPGKFAIMGGLVDRPQRVLLYGTGGIGKSTLAALAPSPVFVDIEGGTYKIDVPRVEGVGSFGELRACLQSDIFDGYKTIVLDSATKAEEWSVAHTLATVPNERGQRMQSVEGYGFGKGLQHVYDSFLLLLADLDTQVRRGRNVIVIAHDCVTDAPNPTGENFIRYEPHLQGPKSGKASIRNRVVQWADHVLYVGYDVVSVDGKGRGTGGRTIWTTERPDHIAKSRHINEEVPFVDASDSTIWSLIFGGK